MSVVTARHTFSVKAQGESLGEKEEMEMTITIHRPVLKTRLALWLGLAAILVVAAIALLQNDNGEAIERRAPASATSAPTATPAEYWSRLQSVQDNYLPPAVTAVTPWTRLQAVQDHHLSPAATAAPAGERTATIGDRVNQPR